MPMGRTGRADLELSSQPIWLQSRRRVQLPSDGVSNHAASIGEGGARAARWTHRPHNFFPFFLSKATTLLFPFSTRSESSSNGSIPLFSLVTTQIILGGVRTGAWGHATVRDRSSSRVTPIPHQHQHAAEQKQHPSRFPNIALGCIGFVRACTTGNA